MKTEKVIEYIVEWLKKYVSDSGMKGFVVGVSGGVDSAVVSKLAAKTGYPVLCVEMPIHQAENQVNRAQEHILSLRKKFPNVMDIHVDLTPPFENLKAQLPKTQEAENYSLVLANTRSRLRMTTLYYFAGLHGFLVTGTGNKVEDFGVGFFTKYGDGGVDISPVADLYKSEIYELATMLGISENIRK
ncbi:MAG TPA: NAD(+) synthase, partial [Flavobacteriaceae bacterium]|nr:NAD(+) synthase [Flavobacteriaceae bacterium]